MLKKINAILPDFLLMPKYRLLRHVILQIVILTTTINIFWDEPDQILQGRLLPWIIYSLQVSFIIYLNMYLLVPRLLIRGKTIYYLLALFFIVFGFNMLFSVGALQDISSDNQFAVVLLESVSAFIAFFVFYIGMTAIQLFKYHVQNNRKIGELENATTAIELANLQNQINPHFLFNTLNNANILADDAEKSTYILQTLNDLLRYQTQGEAKGEVKLSDDIAFLNDYLSLEKTRRDRFDYTISTEGDCNVNIPPLLFIPFIENAIKHNPESDSFIHISFLRQGEKLRFKCENPKAKLAREKKEGGIGLKNIRKRLDLLFGKNYKLNLRDEKEIYTVTLEFKI
ncbi:sensor histidine kinase [Dysgonomonas sp. 521]|uniref:sensor histidine kinase n=1 Tax=unclassified Dysgonomonas TaxID=2630389 RepID=UPI0013D468F2|nr:MULTISPECIES: histidine kinase [unclassified Dysgonomonas]NDV96909.1 sensor histidine kinase [Dysgonomonas sp. 521]NDW08286.1 sensor histidine kinase [Dysgonomonas sp. 520]